MTVLGTKCYVRLVDAMVRPGGEKYQEQYEKAVKKYGLEAARKLRVEVEENG